MAGESAKDRRLIGYLLEQLPEAERTEIEDRFFADDVLFEYLSAVETELIDAYVRGELKDADRVQFERRFLGSPRFRARIVLARQLQTKAVPVATTSAPARDASRQSSQADPAGKKNSPVVGAIAAAVTVAAVAFGWWMMQPSASQAAAAGAGSAGGASGGAGFSPPGLPPVRLPPMEVVLTTAPSGPVDLVLAPGSATSRDGRTALTITPGAELVRIQIDHDGAPRERYAVIVGTPDGQRVWAELAMAPRAPGAKGVIMQIPALSLPAGEYLVTLSGGTLQARRLELVADYSLRVK